MHGDGVAKVNIIMTIQIFFLFTLYQETYWLMKKYAYSISPQQALPLSLLQNYVLDLLESSAFKVYHHPMIFTFYFQVGWHESQPGIRYRQQVVPYPSSAVWGEVCIAARVRQQISYNTVWVAKECSSFRVYYEGIVSCICGYCHC